MYIGVLREQPAFSREPVIFAYHAVSVVVVTASGLALVLALPIAAPPALLVAIAALHGIYSTSFLELWALAEGGYSLSILRAMDLARRSGAAMDLTHLQHIGAAKRQNRALGLVRLGLARLEGETMQVTPRGRLVGAALRIISWPAGLQKMH